MSAGDGMGREMQTEATPFTGSGGQPGPEMVITQQSLNREVVLSGQGAISRILGGREGQIWAGGQPGPEMVICLERLNREMILSGHSVNAQILGSQRVCRRADMGRRPARPRDCHLSIELE